MKEKHYMVLYDGYCLFCGRARKIILLLDWFKLIETVNIYDEEALRQTSLPIPSAEKLAAEVHLLRKDGKVYTGFYACRKIGLLLPLTFLPSLLFYIPGIPYLGEKIYTFIEKSR